jgi:hypothetical protein
VDYAEVTVCGPEGLESAVRDQFGEQRCKFVLEFLFMQHEASQDFVLSKIRVF